MTDVSGALGFSRGGQLGKAIYQNRAWSRAGLSERLFALMFSGLVYPQIWEDPVVDMEAMDLAGDHRVVAIASGGCNVMAYLTRAPARIDAVDLNASHVALNRLKLAAARHLPAHADFLRFFGGSGDPVNSTAYDRFVAPHLDAGSRRYWEGRDWLGRRRITAFDRNFYRTGLLGKFIAAGHRAGRLYGFDPSAMMAADDLAAQRRFFEEKIAPVFRKRVLRALLSRKSSLFGLGIPPAQYDAWPDRPARWPMSCRSAWKGWPAASRSRRTISPGRPSPAATPRPARRRCRPTSTSRISRRYAGAPTACGSITST